MTNEELQYEAGKRRATIKMLGVCKDLLGYNRNDDYASYLQERAETIQQLRELCSLLGDDMNWDDNTYIPDIIEKHVIPHVRRIVC